LTQEQELEVNITAGEKWKRHLEVNLPASEFQPHVDKRLRTVQKRAHVDGFRPGKAPLQVLDRIYGKAVRQQTLEEILPHLLKTACEQSHLHPVGPANLEEVKIESDNSLRFRATLEVEPEAALTNYTGYEVIKTVYEISAEDVAERLEALRGAHGWLESVEEGAQAEHIVTADIQVLDPVGVPLIGQKFENERFRISAQAATPEDFSPLLLGVKPGEERNVRFMGRNPEGQPSERRYRVEVKEVHEQKLPDLDDDFARDLGKFETLEELRRAVSEELKYEAERTSRDALRHQIIDEVLKNNPFELPEGMLEAFTNAYIEDLQKKYKDLKAEDVHEEARSQTARTLKWRYAHARIAELERLLVNEEDVRTYLQALAEAGKEDPKKLINKVMNDEKEFANVREAMQESRVLGFLEGRMKIVERRVAFKERNQPPLISA
jgi:trigger factor